MALSPNPAACIQMVTFHIVINGKWSLFRSEMQFTISVVELFQKCLCIFNDLLSYLNFFPSTMDVM